MHFTLRPANAFCGVLLMVRLLDLAGLYQKRNRTTLWEHHISFQCSYRMKLVEQMHKAKKLFRSYDHKHGRRRVCAFYFFCLLRGLLKGYMPKQMGGTL